MKVLVRVRGKKKKKKSVWDEELVNLKVPSDGGFHLRFQVN